MHTMPLLLAFILFFCLLSNPYSFNRLEIFPQIIIVGVIILVVVVTVVGSSYVNQQQRHLELGPKEPYYRFITS